MFLLANKMEENKTCDKAVQHESIVPCDWYEAPCLEELAKSLPKSGKKYLCPLCTPDKYKPAWPSKVKKHLTSHNHYINLTDYSISVLACHLDCRAKKKDKHAHYHCPSCYKTLARKDGFFTHWEECKQYYTAPSDLAKHEDSGCFTCSDEDTTTENRIESKCCEESMNTVPSIQTNSFDIPDVSYLSIETCTNSDSVTCSEEDIMDTDASDTKYNTEGITMDNITTPPLSEPIAESQTNILRKDVHTVDFTCTPVEESSLITNPDPSLLPFTPKQSQSSFESQPETVEQSYADLCSSIILSDFQENRPTRQDFELSLEQKSVISSLNGDGNDKMECDMALNMIECQEIMNELSPQKLFDEIEGLDHGGKCFEVGEYWQSSSDPDGISQDSENKVQSWEKLPDSQEVELPVNVRSWEYSTIDVSSLDSYLHSNGTLGGFSVNDSTGFDDTDVLKMRGQLDRDDRVALW